MVDLASLIRPGDGVVWGQACAEPQTLVEALVGQREAFSGARVFVGSSYSGSVTPAHADHLRLSSYCGTGTNRALAEAGVLEVLPAPYSQLGSLIRQQAIRADVVLLQVSPPNGRGEYSLALGVEYLAPALRSARVVVGEVNERVPWTQTEPLRSGADTYNYVTGGGSRRSTGFGVCRNCRARVKATALQFLSFSSTVSPPRALLSIARLSDG
jgi:acetyl-CoA hydrolase